MFLLQIVKIWFDHAYNDYNPSSLIIIIINLVFKSSSVPDPWHFDLDPDPDPRIHDSRRQHKTYKKKFFCLLLFEGTLNNIF